MKKTTVSRNKKNQTITLVHREFTVSNTTDSVMSLIVEKLNFHELQRLSLSEGFLGSDTAYSDAKTGERERFIAKDCFKEARKSGAKTSINGTLEISINQLWQC